MKLVTDFTSLYLDLLMFQRCLDHIDSNFEACSDHFVEAFCQARNATEVLIYQTGDRAREVGRTWCGGETISTGSPGSQTANLTPLARRMGQHD
ncbi:hypothetical protein RRG08_004105 [Elysia crispata]|uniref:Uncharacterized protein n=1 Tax=Elysia crispata TaxID=231223 RepID=A0AAE1B200_9GAST|nr:hypothetical protein RRG08_004105 [Elysia crispata]